MTTYDPGGDTTDQLVDHDGYLLPGPRETVDCIDKIAKAVRIAGDVLLAVIVGGLIVFGWCVAGR